MKPGIDLLIENAAELITCAEGAGDLIGRTRDGAIAVSGDKIVAVGSTREIREQVNIDNAKVIDATGKVVAPGFVDCHTHLVFGGTRVAEYAARMTQPASDVAALGIPCGIPATVQMTRAETESSLAESALDRLEYMLRFGSTTVEIKSGYGLSLEDELKMLRVNRLLQERQPIDIVNTYLGAHEFSPDMSRSAYIDNILNEQLPAVADQGIATFCDVYCDDGYYTVKESRIILEAGLGAGLAPKIHTEAYSNIGGANLAADMKMVSADHLNNTNQSQMARLAEAGVVGVIMPALDFAVGHSQPFDARAMLDAGMTLALATDLCPGCWTESQHFVMVLACRTYGMSPEEAMCATTLGGAKALSLESDRGSLETGKLADIQIWDIPTFEDIIYRLDRNVVSSVIKSGHVCF